MTLYHMLLVGISEESAAACWLGRYTGNPAPIIRRGRISMAGTPLFDTNWSPAMALRALIYREMKYPVALIARTIGKSHHAVADLFKRVDQAEGVRGADV